MVGRLEPLGSRELNHVVGNRWHGKPKCDYDYHV